MVVNLAVITICLALLTGWASFRGTKGIGASIAGRISLAATSVSIVAGGAAFVLTIWYFSRPREPWQVDAGLERNAIPSVEAIGTTLYAIAAATAAIAALSFLFICGLFVWRKARMRLSS